MSTETIATVVDGSEEGCRAARFASALARKVGARLVLLAPLFSHPLAPVARGRLADDLRAATRGVEDGPALEMAEQCLEGIRGAFEHVESFEVQVVEVRESLAEALLPVLDEARTLTLVLPRRGPGAVPRLLGNDRDQILDRSPVPVTLVP